MKDKIRSIIFRFTKWLVRKYFSDGLKPIYASDKPVSTEIIAWEWRFYDEQYENRLNKWKTH